MSRARRDLLERLRDQDEATTVDALATACGQHPNTVREHLEALVAAGQALRVAQPSPTGRGRPARRYRAAPHDAAPAAAATLAAVLAAQLDGRPDARTEGLAAGRAWAASLPAGDDAVRAAEAPDHELLDYVGAALGGTGFATEPVAGDPAVLRLTRCPLLEAARAHPDVVCSVHLGLVQGLLAAAGHDGTQARLLPFAAPGACLLRLETATAP